MSNSIVDTLLFLANPIVPVKESEKANLRKIANAILDTDLTDDNKNNVVSALMMGATTEDTYKAIVIESMLLAITGDAKHSAKLAKHLSNYKPALAEANATHMNLMWQDFSADSGANRELFQHCQRRATRPLFEHLVSSVEQLYTDEIAQPPAQFKRTNRVVIITKQMLLPPHAPSVRTLEFGKSLKENYNKEVLLVCSSEMTGGMDGAIIPAHTAMYDDCFMKLDTITYEDCKMPFLMCGQGIFSEASFRQGVRAIHDFAPEMILSIGAPNLLAEVFHKIAFCFFYVSGRGLPLTRHQYFHTWEAPNEEEPRYMQEEKIDDRLLFVSTPGYHAKEQYLTLTKAEFDIPEDSFVYAVIGLRLDSEIDDSFVKLLTSVEQETDAYFIFAGIFERFETCFEAHPALKEKCRFLDMQADIMAVYALADVFLNPERKGGGSSAAQALQAGLPVLTLPTGDVGFMATNFPKLADYDAMATVATQLATDEATMQAYKEYTTKEAARISVRDEFLGRVMEEFEKFAQNKEQTQTQEGANT